MYRDRFGLQCKPFGNTPDPLFFYFSADHRQGLVTLSQGIHERCGLMLLLGGVGTGKTNLCYHLHNHEGFSSAYLNYPFLTESEFLESVNKELGIPVGDGSRRRNRAELQDYLLRQQNKGNPVVIIVDEAHRLGIPILDEILILSNLQVADGHLLQIILAGQPLLLDTLKQPRLQSLNQRIGLRYHLARMDRANTIDYICHRLAKAGCTNQSLFSPGALDTIWEKSHGTPRLINLLSERALNEAYRRGKKGVGRRQVNRVADDPLYQPLFAASAKADSTADSRAKPAPSHLPLALLASLFSPSFPLLSWREMLKVFVKRRVTMPFIKIEAGKMDKETKEKLISGLTKVASETLGIPEDAFTILLKENETDNWGVGGKVLTKVLEERANK